MNIVVCLQPRAAGASASRADVAALAQALALAARESGHHVTALLPGTSAQANPLVEALAAGAARAVRLAGEDLCDADFHTLGQVFAAGIKQLGADLVLTGLGTDGDVVGAAPAATARQLGYVHVSGIEELATGAPDASGAATVEVVVRGGGRKRRLRVSLPALFSVAAGATDVPPPPKPGKGKAKGAASKKEIEVLSLADPERTVVRRRSELLGSAEAASRTTEMVSSATAFADALRGKSPA